MYSEKTKSICEGITHINTHEDLKKCLYSIIGLDEDIGEYQKDRIHNILYASRNFLFGYFPIDELYLTYIGDDACKYGIVSQDLTLAMDDHLQHLRGKASRDIILTTSLEFIHDIKIKWLLATEVDKYTLSPWTPEYSDLFRHIEKAIDELTKYQIMEHKYKFAYP